MRRRLLDPASALTLQYGRPVLIVLLLYGALLLLAAASLWGSDGKGTQTFLSWAITLLAIGLSWRPVAQDHAAQRWSLLFQLPLDPAAYYARLFLLSVLLGLGVMLFSAGALSLIAVATGNPAMPLWRGILGGIYWVFLLIAVSFGISSTIRKHRDFEILLVLLMVSVFQRVITNALGLSAGGTVTALSLVLLPVDGALQLWEWVRGQAWRPDSTQVWHMALYPLVWLSLGWYRLRRGEIA